MRFGFAWEPICNGVYKDDGSDAMKKFKNMVRNLFCITWINIGTIYREHEIFIEMIETYS